ncbi:MAG TPA: ion transporter [Ignavibacteria bacterium]|nr:ion transporter [Ignavibacteria bacterium]HMQ98744.1 ion transporter [Ignavibacteria bacterium]
MAEYFRKIVDSKAFQYFIVGVILAAGVIVGLETYPALMQTSGDLLHLLDHIVLYIFVAEILIKIGAKGSKPWEYFNDGWNVFDFIIVAVCFMPIGGAYIAVLRLARILRVFRLVSALPKLQILVGALLKSIPSMSYVGILLFLLFYIYAVIGTFMFGQNDPIHFGSLQVTMMTLFKTITLEGWIDFMNIQVYGSNVYGYENFPDTFRVPSAHPFAAPVYFVSFILLGTMIMLNLFIGVIISGMEETNKEEEIKELARIREELKNITVEEEINLIAEDLNKINENLKLLKNRINTTTRA